MTLFRHRPHLRRYERSRPHFTLAALLAYLYGCLWVVMHTTSFFYPLDGGFFGGYFRSPSPEDLKVLDAFRLGGLLFGIWLTVILVTDLLWSRGPRLGRCIIHGLGAVSMYLIAYAMHMVMHF